MENNIEKVTALNNEQISNSSLVSKVKAKDYDLDVAQLVYRGVEVILEKDEYDIFAIRSKKVFDNKIAKINFEIEKLIQSNVKLKEDEKRLSEQIVKLKTDNVKKIVALKEKLL